MNTTVTTYTDEEIGQIRLNVLNQMVDQEIYQRAYPWKAFFKRSFSIYGHWFLSSIIISLTLAAIMLATSAYALDCHTDTECQDKYGGDGGPSIDHHLTSRVDQI